MSEDKYSQWEELVHKVSRNVAKDFPETEQEDLFQELMLFVFSTDSLDPLNPGAVAVLQKKATMVCWDNRKVSLSGTSQYCYRPSDVRKILETISREDWDQTFVPDDQISEFADDSWIAAIDVSIAFDLIPVAYQKAITDRFRDNVDVSSTVLTRAVQRLTDVLNDGLSRYEHEGVGSRKVVNGATSRYLIDNLT